MTADELDGKIEAWFDTRWQCRIDFEIGDAPGKLEALGLATCSGGRWQVSGA